MPCRGITIIATGKTRGFKITLSPHLILFSATPKTGWGGGKFCVHFSHGNHPWLL